MTTHPPIANGQCPLLMSFTVQPTRLPASGTEPVESESKQQTTVEKAATSKPEYTWSQSADEVTFEMPVRFQCARCVRAQKWWASKAMPYRLCQSLHAALHSTLRFVALCTARRHHHLTMRCATTSSLHPSLLPRPGDACGCCSCTIPSPFDHDVTVSLLASRTRHSPPALTGTN